jgi:predicted nucleic acid-binding protein
LRPSAEVTLFKPFSSASSIRPVTKRPRYRPSVSSNSSTESTVLIPPQRRARREAFVEELLSTVAIYPLTTDIARLAGKLDAEQQSRGIVVPFADLLIGATALSLGYSVLTVNARHFGRIPGLSVIQL